MWGELVIVAIALTAVSAVVARWAARHRAQGAGPPPGVRGEGAWTAAGGPLDAAFPSERTPHERDIGDAAFVDGFVIGRYYAPEPESQVGGDRRIDGPVVAGGLEGDDEPAWVDDGADGATAAFEADPEVADRDVGTEDLASGAMSWSVDHRDEVVDDFAEGVLDDEAEFDDGFGFEDGFDDDW